VIEIESVSWKMMDENVKCQIPNVKCQIAYLKISHFNEDTEQDFKKAVLEILKKNPKGIILDLRNNPGGFLETAIKVASYWIEDGTVVIEQRNVTDFILEKSDVAPDRQRLPSNSLPSRKDYPSQGQALLKDLPTIVLINQGSASGSEIVAGALQDYKKATLIGKKTFGKGSVQELESLRGGSAVKITVAHWLTPKGRSIEEEGISPDIEVELTDQDYQADRDPQLDKAIDLLIY
jgi:carboxyl-terminal processing protease